MASSVDRPSLAQTQRLFWTLITAAEGAEAGLSELSAAERAVAVSFVRDRGSLSATERLDVYANMYFFRILDVLKEDFAAVCAEVGDDEFHNLITDYLLVHPSSHFSLRFVGQQLPGYLETHRLLQGRPYLSELARFEWAMTEAFDAPDVEPLLPIALAEIEPERWPSLRFIFTPSLRLWEAAWPVIQIWRSTRDQAGELERSRGRTLVRVWRQNLTVWHREIPSDEFRALVAIEEGQTFADVCELLAEGSDEQHAAERAATLIRLWLADGLLTAVR